MSETERKQTTKGIWMSRNKRAHTDGLSKTMADNILIMDVEGTDGRERGEDQDFERKSALFALATSEVLIVNIWEHQVGLYQGANMGLLKVVFEVNLELFLKGNKWVFLNGSCPHNILMSQEQPSLSTLLRHQRPSRYHPSCQSAEYFDTGPLTDLGGPIETERHGEFENRRLL